MVSANFPAGVAWNAKIIARRGRLDFRIEYHAIAAEHEISLAANEREYTRIRRLTFAFIRGQKLFVFDLGFFHQLIHEHRIDRQLAVLVALKENSLAVGGKDWSYQMWIAGAVLA
jgi:hypothetical protein